MSRKSAGWWVWRLYHPGAWMNVDPNPGGTGPISPRRLAAMLESTCPYSAPVIQGPNDPMPFNHLFPVSCGHSPDARWYRPEVYATQGEALAKGAWEVEPWPH